MFLKRYEPPLKYMENHVDLRKARRDFLTKKNRVLYELVKSRYGWMNAYIKDSDNCIYEIGCGMGVSKQFLKNPNVILTDVLENPWVDRFMDAMELDLEDDSVDVFICSNVIHHFASPYQFIQNAKKKLKKGGRIIFFEPYTSILMRMAQKALRLEGWDEDTDVFSPDTICNIEGEPWSANESVPKLLFQNKTKFEKVFPGLKIRKYELTECLLFLCSGGG